jgi:glycosyltransferase involved in cell wall biosynthesis
MSGTRPMPVYQVASYYPPHLGGLEVVAKAIAERLALKYPVTVLTSTVAPQQVQSKERRGNLVVRRLKTFEFAHVPFMPSLLLHLLRAPGNAIMHVHVGVAWAPEMVWIYSMLRRRPYVAHYHLDVDPSGRLGWLFLVYKKSILNLVLRSAACVIAVSPEQPDFLAKHHGVPRERVVLLPNGVGAEFSPIERDAPNRSRPLRLLFVGRLAPQKNVPLLLAALAKMQRPVELTIVGDGEDRALVQTRIRELKLDNVVLAGAKRGQDLVDAYHRADAFVLTSVKESTGLVLLEAFATGLPVIAVDAPGVRNTVGDAGLLPSPDAAALATALDHVAADPALWSELARRSLGRSQQYSWDKTLRRLEKVYEEVFSPHKLAHYCVGHVDGR